MSDAAARRLSALDALFLGSVAVLLFLTAADTLAQSEPPMWVRSPRITSHAPDRGWDLAVHPSGEISVVGSSAGELAILRVDARGDRLWSRRDRQLGVALGADAVPAGEGVFVVGHFDDDDDHWSRVYYADRSGDIAWSLFADDVRGVAADHDGGLITSGATELGTTTMCPSCPAVIRRFDVHGIVWTAFVDVDRPLSAALLAPLAVDPSGSSYGAFRKLPGHRLASSIVKFAPDGSRSWTRSMAADGAPGDVQAVALATTADGLIVAATTLDRGGRLLSMAADGTETWWRPLPGDFETRAAVGDDRIYVAGAVNRGGNRDVSVAAYNLAGDLLWQTTHDTAADDDAVLDIAVARRQGIVVLAQNADGVLLMELHRSGRIHWVDPIIADDAVASSLALDRVGRPHVAGTVAGPGAGDLAVWRWKAPRKARLLDRFDRVIEAAASTPVALTAGGGDLLITQRSTFGFAMPPAIETTDLASYSSGGDANRQVRIRSVTGASDYVRPWRIVTTRSGATIVARTTADGAEVRRYDATAELEWQTFPILGDVSPWRDPVMSANQAGEVVLSQWFDNANHLVMLDAEGQEVWRRELGSPEYSRFLFIEDRGFYALAREGGLNHAYRFDASGERLWSTPIDPIENLSAALMTIDASGSLYLAHWIDLESWVTLSIDPGGAVAWTRLETPGFPTLPVAMVAAPGGGVVVTGTVPGDPRSDVRTMRYAATGEALWTGLLEDAGRGLGLGVDASGNVFVSAFRVGAYDTRTVSYDSSGNQRWLRSYKVQEWTEPMALTVAADGSVFVAGELRERDAEDREMTRTFVLKYANDGELLLARTGLGPPEAIDRSQVVRAGPAFPNPARGPVTLPFVLPSSGKAALIVVDASGRVVSRIGDREFVAGAHALTWDGRTQRGDRAPQGIYFYRLEADGSTRSGKLLIVR